MSVENLTDLTVRKLNPTDGKRLDVWDRKVPGFGIRVSPSGTKSFVLKYRVHERQRRMTIGRYPDMTLAEARRRALEARAKIARNEDPAGASKVLKLTFEAVMKDFIELHCLRHNKPRTVQSTKRLLANECLPRWRGTPVGEITRRDIIGVLDAMVARGSPGAANNAFAAMSKFFNWCASRDLIGASPCVGVQRPSKPNKRSRVLSGEELSAVWEGAERTGYPFGRIVQLLILTGQRRGEVAGMEWHQIDWDEKHWNIPEEATKNSQAHTVPLSDAALGILERVPRLHDRFVFPARGSATTWFSGFGKCKERLDREVNIGGWCLHDLRRTAATGFAALGIQPHVVERILNHKSGVFGGVAGVYNRFEYQDEMRAGLDRWACHVLEGTGRAPPEKPEKNASAVALLANIEPRPT